MQKAAVYLTNTVSVILSGYLIYPLLLTLIILGKPLPYLTDYIILILITFFPFVLINILLYIFKSGWDFKFNRAEKDIIYLSIFVGASLATTFSGIRNLPLEFIALTTTTAILFGILYFLNQRFININPDMAVFVYSVFFLVNFVSTAFTMMLISIVPYIWFQTTIRKQSWLQIMVGVCVGAIIGLLSWI